VRAPGERGGEAKGPAAKICAGCELATGLISSTLRSRWCRAQLLLWTRRRGSLLALVDGRASLRRRTSGGLPVVAASGTSRLACGAVRPLSAKCLVQAIALQQLLESRGLTGSAVHIGVRRKHGRLFAHAWVEYQRLVLSDDEWRVQQFNGAGATGAGWTSMSAILGVFGAPEPVDDGVVDACWLGCAPGRRRTGVWRDASVALAAGRMRGSAVTQFQRRRVRGARRRPRDRGRRITLLSRRVGATPHGPACVFAGARPAI